MYNLNLCMFPSSFKSLNYSDRKRSSLKNISALESSCCHSGCARSVDVNEIIEITMSRGTGARGRGRATPQPAPEPPRGVVGSRYLCVCL